MIQLSIIVPVYNVEKYIRACLESVFKQGLNDDCFEVIIVNDGTQDNSMEMITDIVNQHNNITIINQENQGLSVARNNGIAAAKGEYIIMPDSDDLLVGNSLKLLLDKALETKADMVIADFLSMNDNEIENIDFTQLIQPTFEMYEKTGKDYFIEDMLPTQCYVWRILFKRDFIIENSISFYPGICFQDVPFIHECYLKANKCLRVSVLLNIYRRGHKTAASSPFSFSAKKARDLCIAIKIVWQLEQLNSHSPALRKKFEDNIYSLYTNFCFKILHFLNNREEAIQSLKFLNQQVSDLRFTNGVSQRIADFLRRKTPRIYLICLSHKWDIYQSKK